MYFRVAVKNPASMGASVSLAGHEWAEWGRKGATKRAGKGGRGNGGWFLGITEAFPAPR